MKTEELLIDGVRVDMSPDTRITLNFKSNLLNDISKITASNSQTINLPKTLRNRSVFDHATSPARNSAFPYQRHTAEYIRNGVKIISGAYAVMLSASESFEIALYWGEMTRFQKWTESGAKLNDLSFDDLVQVWSNTIAKTYCVDASDDDPDVYIDDGYLINADYDCGVGSTDTIPATVKSKIWLHKFVSVRMILQRIQQDSGITFNFPSGYMTRPGSSNSRGLFRSVAVPLTTRKTSSSTARNASAIESHTSQGWRYYNVGVTFTLPASTYYTTEDKRMKFNIWGETAQCTVIKNKYPGRARMSLIFIVKTSVKSSGYVPDAKMIIRSTSSGGFDLVWDTRPTKSESLGKSGGRYYFSQTFAFTPEFDAIEDDEIFVGFYLTDGYRFHGITSASLSFTPPATESNISLGEMFKAKGNFPDITQLDFVKAICGLFGLFVVPSGVENTIKFASIDLLVGNKSNAADWSGKLIRERADGDPREIKYSYGEYARRNWFKYKDDDTVETSGNATLDVNNESLEVEKDAITLPFAATDEKTTTFGGVNTTLARIPHYELDDNGNPQDVALTPRLVCMRGGGANGNEAYARFVPISFAGMIARYYQQLAAILNSAVIIKEKLRLTEYDILGLDFTRPVYLKQYGRYYGVISVQTESDICTVELLQLPEQAPEVLALLFSQNDGETWAANCPTNWSGELLVKTTPGRNLTADDIGAIAQSAASSGAARRLDLSECTFVSDDVPVVVAEIDTENHIYNLDNIWYLIFPPNIRTIKRKAFYYAWNIRQFEFPDGIREFAWQSFEYCYNVRQLEFPASVEYIGDVAFGYCQKCTLIRFRGTTPPEIDYSAFHNAGIDYDSSQTWKTVRVPLGTREAYYAQPGIARIVDDFGFTLIEY